MQETNGDPTKFHHGIPQGLNLNQWIGLVLREVPGKNNPLIARRRIKRASYDQSVSHLRSILAGVVQAFSTSLILVTTYIVVIAEASVRTR